MFHVPPYPTHVLIGSSHLHPPLRDAGAPSKTLAGAGVIVDARPAQFPIHLPGADTVRAPITVHPASLSIPAPSRLTRSSLFAMLLALISLLCFTSLPSRPPVDTPTRRRLNHPFSSSAQRRHLFHTEVPHPSFPLRLTRALMRVPSQHFPLFLACPRRRALSVT